MHALILYYTPTCGYCQKVLRFLDGRGLKIKLKNVSADPAIRREMLDLVGRTQVPCLIHDGEILHESDDIIAWLDENGEV